MAILRQAMVSCAFILAGPLGHAADVSAPSLGTKVRVTIAGEATPIVGTIASADKKSLTVLSQASGEPSVVAREAILRLEQSTKPSRKGRGALIGFGVGLTASLGKVAMQGGCNDGCDGSNVLVAGMVAASTAVVGALASSGERWEDVPTARNAWRQHETGPSLRLVPRVGRGIGLTVVGSF